MTDRQTETEFPLVDSTPVSTTPFYNDDFYFVMYLEAGAQQAQGNM